MRNQADKIHSRVVPQQSLSRMKRGARKNPGHLSPELFMCIGETTMLKSTQKYFALKNSRTGENASIDTNIRRKLSEMGRR